MALGDQSKALRLANMTAGMRDSNLIYDGDKVVGDISNFDKAPDRVNHDTVGELPGGPKLGWPDGYDLNLSGEQSVTWNATTLRENENHRTKNGNPVEGKPGA